MNTMNEQVVSHIKHDINVVIGRHVMLLRKSRGLTGQDLAKKLRVSQQQVSRYERGVCKIDMDTLIIVLMHLQVSLEFFFQKVALSLKEDTPKLYGYYQSVFPSVTIPESDSHQYYLMKVDEGSHYFR
ncbi:helix-turn-helix domain-containing protein [Providencia rettgeri]|uniref:helix-turn-helix domain-containing protein n=1 Tax=Providencia rettgeri TaxID=587 RepID=UPI0018E4C212|nr:helix-turn-helix transcriptional regulator [Providencia rettgeri]MBI6194819.1 helix-turn-helix transcriptional regulator [Providencia rettgeri]